MNEEEIYQMKLDAVWERFLMSLAIEKMKKVEKLEYVDRQSQSLDERKGA